MRVFFHNKDDDAIVVMLDIHETIPEKPYHFTKHSTAEAFVDAHEIVEAIYWYEKQDSLFAIIPDFI